MTSSPVSANPDATPRSSWIALAVLILGVSMALLDTTVDTGDHAAIESGE